MPVPHDFPIHSLPKSVKRTRQSRAGGDSKPIKTMASAQKRKCLRCETVFLSKGIHNRLCRTCGQVSVTPYCDFRLVVPT